MKPGLKYLVIRITSLSINLVLTRITLPTMTTMKLGILDLITAAGMWLPGSEKCKGYVMRFFLLISLLVLSACNNSSFRPLFYPDIPKDGPPLYQQGFKEGCNTGMTVYGNDIVRMEYATQVTPELMKDKTYRNAWKLGNRYCRFHLSQMQMEGTFVKDFGTPVYPNRMIPNETEWFRERLTDSFWHSLDVENNPWLTGYNMPWTTIDSGADEFNGSYIGREGGVFNILSQ